MHVYQHGPASGPGNGDTRLWGGPDDAHVPDAQANAVGLAVAAGEAVAVIDHVGDRAATVKEAQVARALTRLEADRWGGDTAATAIALFSRGSDR